MDNYESAFKMLQKFQLENKAFADFVEAAERKPDMQMLDLTSLLISPIQRIPRYRLLLQSLVAETWPEHPDAENLNKALRKMDEITQYVNNKRKEAESSRKLVELQNELTGSPDSIIVESRKFVTVRLVDATGHHGTLYPYFFCPPSCRKLFCMRTTKCATTALLFSTMPFFSPSR
jgi:hypothetical protein